VTAAALADDSGSPGFQRELLALALALFAAGTWLLLAEQGWRMAALWLIGGLLGLVLYHAAFGFTSAYRRMFLRREVAGVQAQLLMLALATLLFAPLLAQGAAFGQPVGGAIAPLGLQVVVGAFLFGLGMQLGGGCGSGTLYAVGGGSPRMLVTLVAFCAGSFWASLHMQWWAATPRLPALALGRELGWPLAVALQLGLLVALAVLLRRWGRPVPSPADRRAWWRRLLFGDWPVLWGAVALALLNVLTLVVSGHPWSITWGFTLWGAELAQLFGWDPTGDWFWGGGFPGRALAGSLLADDTSVMDAGIVLGALTAAALAGRYAPRLRIPLASLVAAGLGGLLMGYGARIAFGCNIGAFFSGVASTSLHGWLWLAAALPGTWVGLKLRPRFGLANS
jgi:hypothetical protein